MGVSKSIAKSKQKALSKWFPVIANAVEAWVSDTKTASRLETIEVLTDIDQVTTLFSSMEDWRLGQIASMDSAFGDL